MRSVRRAPALLAAAGLVGGLLTAAAAEPKAPTRATRVPLVLGAPEVVSTYHSTDSWWPVNAVSVADSSGIVTAAWDKEGLLVAQRDAQGVWSAPATLRSCPTEDLSGCQVSGYTLAVDGAGTVSLAWIESSDTSAGVYVSSLSRGGTWSTPYRLGRPRGRTNGWLSVTAARDGAALLTFDTRSSHGPTVAAVYRSPGSSWASARRRAFAGVQQAATGLDDRGRAVMVVRGIGKKDNRMHAFRYRPGSGWSHRVSVGASMHYDMPVYSLAVGHHGRALLAWRAGGYPVEETLRARLMNRHGRWAPSHTLQRHAGNVYSEHLQVSVRRTASVLWSTQGGAIRWATKTPGHPWRTRSAYPRKTGVLEAMDVNARGDLAILWTVWHRSGAADLVVGVHTWATGWTAGRTVPALFLDDISPRGSVSVLPGGAAMVLSYRETSSGDASYDTTTLGWTVTPTP